MDSFKIIYLQNEFPSCGWGLKFNFLKEISQDEFLPQSWTMIHTTYDKIHGLQTLQLWLFIKQNQYYQDNATYMNTIAMTQVTVRNPVLAFVT